MLTLPKILIERAVFYEVYVNPLYELVLIKSLSINVDLSYEAWTLKSECRIRYV